MFGVHSNTKALSHCAVTDDEKTGKIPANRLTTFVMQARYLFDR